MQTKGMPVLHLPCDDTLHRRASVAHVTLVGRGSGINHTQHTQHTTHNTTHTYTRSTYTHNTQHHIRSNFGSSHVQARARVAHEDTASFSRRARERRLTQSPPTKQLRPEPQAPAAREERRHRAQHGCRRGDWRGNAASVSVCLAAAGTSNAFRLLLGGAKRSVLRGTAQAGERGHRKEP